VKGVSTKIKTMQPQEQKQLSSPKKKRLRLPFAERAKAMSSTKQPSQEKSPESKSSNTLRSLIKIPLHIFIDCIVDKDYSGLGSTDPDVIKEAWSEIEADYLDFFADDKTKRILNLKMELTLLMGRYDLFISMCNVIISMGDIQCQEVNDLKGMINKSCDGNFKFEEEKYDEIKRALKRMESVKLNIQLKQIELDVIMSSIKKKESKPSREFFAKAIITLSDFSEYNLSDKEMTAFDFFERMKRYKKYIKEYANRKH
jgi:hypothetical protein